MLTSPPARVGGASISRPLSCLVGYLSVTGIGVILLGCSQQAPPSAATALPVPPGEPSLFVDMTRESGVDFTYRNGEEAGHFAIIESLGGGVALLDYDGDGRLDLFLPGGGYFDGQQVRGHPCRLYRNLGRFRFEDVTARVGLDRIDFPYSHGAAVFDYNRDNWPDLLVTGYNRVVLLANQADAGGGRRFVDVTRAAGLNDRLWSTSAAWGDLDGDGFPELYIAHYGDWGFDNNHPTDCTYDGKTRDVCQPRRFKPLPDTLYRNNGDGTFSDRSAELKPRSPGKAIGVVLADLNNDGRPDIYVANDTDDNHLYMNRGKVGELRLEEVGLFAGVARDDRGQANGSMGLGVGDYDRSGLASLVVTNYENELPALYRNRGGQPERFSYDTLVSGVAAIGGYYVSWGTSFTDWDNDGWEDLLIVNGHAIRFPLKLDRRQRPVLLRNQAGRFRAVATTNWPYLGEPHNARGFAVGDLDDDGRPDLVISHLNEPVVVLKNVAPTEGRHWIGFRLLGRNNADVVGARVVVETAGGRQTRYALGGGSYGSSHDPRLHLGLGPDTRVERATVYWPSGLIQEISGLEVDSYWLVCEGQSTATRIVPPEP